MTGLRQGELLALRWRDLDWAARRVRVADNYPRGRYDRVERTKSHLVRSVPLADRLAGELDRHFQASAWQSDDDLVFCHPHTGRPHDASRLRKRFDAALARAGLRRITFHELRRTFGTQMAAAGAPLRAIQEWMGHADAATTQIYAHYAPDATNGAGLVEAPSAVPPPTRSLARRGLPRPRRSRRPASGRETKHPERGHCARPGHCVKPQSSCFKRSSSGVSLSSNAELALDLAQRISRESRSPCGIARLTQTETCIDKRSMRRYL